MTIRHEQTFSIREDSLGAMKILLDMEYAWNNLGYKTHIDKTDGGKAWTLFAEIDIPWEEGEADG